MIPDYPDHGHPLGEPPITKPIPPHEPGNPTGSHPPGKLKPDRPIRRPTATRPKTHKLVAAVLRKVTALVIGIASLAIASGVEASQRATVYSTFSDSTGHINGYINPLNHSDDSTFSSIILDSPTLTNNFMWNSAGANSLLGTLGSGTLPYINALTVPSCNANGKALGWVTNGGLSCNTTIAATTVSSTDTAITGTDFITFQTAEGTAGPLWTSGKLQFDPSTGFLSVGYAGTAPTSTLYASGTLGSTVNGFQSIGDFVSVDTTVASGDTALLSSMDATPNADVSLDTYDSGIAGFITDTGDTKTITGLNMRGGWFEAYHQAASYPPASTVAIYADAQDQVTGTLPVLYGLQSSTQNTSSGTVTTGSAVKADLTNGSTGTISTAQAITASVNNTAGGTMTNATGIASTVTNPSSGTVSSTMVGDASTVNNAGTAAALNGRSTSVTNSGTVNSGVYGLSISALSNSGTITGTTYGISIGNMHVGTQTGGSYGIYESDILSPNYLSPHTGYHGTAPTLSSCNTSPSVDSYATDTSGTIAVGATGGNIYACTLTFAHAYTTWNHCVVSSSDYTTVVTETVSLSTLVISTGGGSMAGKHFTYFCEGN
jgi:hypothetical protein